MAEENQKLGIAILEFLEKSIMDGSVLEDDKQKIEVASKPFVLLIMPPKFGLGRSAAPSMAIGARQRPKPRVPSQ